MSIPTLKIYKLACEYSFAPKLSFYDHMHTLGDNLFRDYKHWSRASSKIDLTNFTNRSALTLEHNRLSAIVDIPSSVDLLTTRFSRAWKEYYSAIKPDSFRRLGLRIQGIVPVEMTFEELLGITHPKLFNTDSRITKILGPATQDYMYNVITSAEKNATHLICGPVRDFEVTKFFQPVNLVLDEGETPPEITFPRIGFWIDCDFFRDKPDNEDHKTFVENALRKVTVLTQELTNYILGH